MNIDLINKKELIEFCILNRQSIAENAKMEMNEFQQQANEYGSPKDRYDSFRAQLLRKRDLFAEQYQKVLDEIALLNRINCHAKSLKAEFGAIIITDNQNLFVATGIGKIVFQDLTFFIISTHVPVFKAVDGLKEGDSFEVNGKKFVIKTIL